MLKLNRRLIIEGVSLLYVSLMFYTALSKLINFELAREQFSMMPMLETWGNTVAWLLPVSEIILALIIFIPKTRNIGLAIGTGLMLFFTGYVIYIMNYHSHLPCTCGGLLQKMTWPQHLFFNSVFVLLGLIAMLLSRISERGVGHGHILPN